MIHEGGKKRFFLKVLVLIIVFVAVTVLLELPANIMLYVLELAIDFLRVASSEGDVNSNSSNAYIERLERQRAEVELHMSTFDSNNCRNT